MNSSKKAVVSFSVRRNRAVRFDDVASHGTFRSFFSPCDPASVPATAQLRQMRALRAQMNLLLAGLNDAATAREMSDSLLEITFFLAANPELREQSRVAGFFLRWLQRFDQTHARLTEAGDAALFQTIKDDAQRDLQL